MNAQEFRGTAQHGPLGAGLAAEPQESAFELGDVLRILSERRKIIVGAGLLGLVLGIIASLLMTPLYRATATLEVNPSANEMLDTSGKAGQSQATAVNGDRLILTQIGLLGNEALVRRVVEDLNLASNPAYGGDEGTRQQRADRATRKVQDGMTVDQVKGSMLIQVTQVSTDPAMAARIANSLSSGFIASSLERRYDSSSYARKFLSDQLARTKTALEESERNLNSYAIESGVFRNPGVQGSDGRTTEGGTLAQTDLAALSNALNEARVKRITAEQAFRSASTDFVADQAADMGTLIQQRAELQAQYDEQLQTFKPEYPAMRELRARITRLDGVISSERSRTSGSKRAELRGDFLAAQRAEAQIAAQVNAAKGQVQSERVQSTQYTILQREADTNRALYDALLQRFKEIGVAGGIGQSIVALVDQARAPQSAFRPRIPVNAGLGLVLGLALGVGLAFAVHLLFDAITDPTDIRTKLHLPVLGVIPLDTDDRTLMEALADRKSDVSEAYYSVRTALKFSRPEGAPRSLLVTSTKPGEGKSTTAYAIASSMARLGGRVLLIDADLRKPTFVSKREDGYGLAHLLGTEDPLSAYVEATQLENLSLVPVGRFVGSAAELLSSNRLPAIIAEASQAFDMVVIDGPPVLGLTDAPLLGSVAEATALVIESRASRTNNVLEMVRRLREAGANLIGVVLTKVSNNGNGYGYSYYSYSYGSDGIGGRVSSDPSRALDLS